MDTPVRPWLRAVYWTLARDDEAGLRTLLTTYRERVQHAQPPPPPTPSSTSTSSTSTSNNAGPEHGGAGGMPPPAQLLRAVDIRVRYSGSVLVLGDEAALHGRYAFVLPISADAPLSAVRNRLAH